MRRDSVAAQLWAEFVGTFILIVLGNGVVAHVIYRTRLAWEDGATGAYNWNTITLGWAFAVALAVYVAGGITGAHINPAVTLAAMVRRTIDVTVGLGYMVAQVAGAFVASALVWLIYRPDFDSGYLNAFYTGPAAGYEGSWTTLYVTEIAATFFLVLFIYAIVDNVRNVGPGANLWPFMVGMAVFAIGLSLGGPTGYAINPARDFGPRLFAWIFMSGDETAFADSYWLVPIIGPLVGGVAGALFYDFLIKPFLPLPAEPSPEPRGADVPHEEPAAGD